MEIGGLDLQEREIAPLVRADQRRVHGAAVRNLDPDDVRPVHHVVVRQNVAVVADNYARAERPLRAHARLTPLCVRSLSLVEEPAEQAFVRHRGLGGCRPGFRADRDDSGRDDLHDIGVRVVEAVSRAWQRRLSRRDGR